MNRNYFAYNWLIDFDAVDFNRLLDFVDEQGLELRRSNIGNKFLRLALAVDNEQQLHQFTSRIDESSSSAEWDSIPYEEFESAILIEHSQKKRTETLTMFDLMQKYTSETSKFYREVCGSDKSNRLFRIRWTINKKGLDERVIEKTFDAVEGWNDVYVAIYRPNLVNYFEIYVVMSDSLNLDELMPDIPLQVAEADWVEISSDDVPDEVSGHPYKYDTNVYVAWREGLYEWLLQANN